MSEPLHVPTRPIRFVTAAGLFDGHDASINIMRRILQTQGAEVIHLGHNRSVDEVVLAAIQEDVAAIAISSYQGGHVEYFSYLVDLLVERGAGQIKVFGGGGGVIVPDEIALLAQRGVRIFSPEDGQRYGLERMVNLMIEACDTPRPTDVDSDALLAGEIGALARTISLIEADELPAPFRTAMTAAAAANRTVPVPVLGITGTGGSGKSSLTDELVRRIRLDQQDKLRVAVIAVDPTRRRGGGALLGDRIRMNGIEAAASGTGVYFRSLATRGARELPEYLTEAITAVRAAGYDIVIVETPGIGQGDAAVVPFVDTSLYVMTPEFGAASQLEKIDMLDFADVVAINKFERRGAEDARRDVARQMARNRTGSSGAAESMPVFGTSAARFNDDGVTALYQQIRTLLTENGAAFGPGRLAHTDVMASSSLATVLPPARVRYLSEVADTVRGYHGDTAAQVTAARRAQQLRVVRELVAERGADTTTLDELAAEAAAELPAASPQGPGPMAGHRCHLLRRRARGEGPRQRDPHGLVARIAVRQPDPAGVPAPLRRRGRAAALPAQREPARLLPLHGRGFPVQARR